MHYLTTAAYNKQQVLQQPLLKYCAGAGRKMGKTYKFSFQSYVAPTCLTVYQAIKLRNIVCCVVQMHAFAFDVLRKKLVKLQWLTPEDREVRQATIKQVQCFDEKSSCLYCTASTALSTIIELPKAFLICLPITQRQEHKCLRCFKNKIQYAICKPVSPATLIFRCLFMQRCLFENDRLHRFICTSQGKFR